MAPSTPPKRRLSSSSFPTLYTPVTAKKQKESSSDKNKLPHADPQSTPTSTQRTSSPKELDSPITPDVTPRSTKVQNQMYMLRGPPDGTDSDSHVGGNLSAKLRLEALSKSLDAPTSDTTSSHIEPKKTTGLGIRDPEIDSNLTLHVNNDPNTPKASVINSEDVLKFAESANRKLFREFSSSEDEDEQEVDINVALESGGDPIVNPFIEPAAKKRSPKLFNPFQTFQKPKPRTDYATKLELYNGRTGKYSVSDLTERERRIKPKKLDFSKFATPAHGNDADDAEKGSKSISKGSDNENESTKEKKEEEQDNMGKKYLMKNLNGFVIDIQPKNSLGFEIFKDDE